MYKKLPFSTLFDGLGSAEIEQLLRETKHDVRQYSTGDIIALKGAQYVSLMVLVDGAVKFETTDKWGKESGSEKLTAPSILLPILLFSANNKMQVNIVAAEPSEVLFIGKSALMGLMRSDGRVLENFLSVISNRNRPLSDSLMYMGFKSIKGKFANLLLEQSASEGSDTVRLKMTQREMAELFGVTRPALARAIGEMSEEGAIYANRKNITIIYPEKLKQYANKRRF